MEHDLKKMTLSNIYLKLRFEIQKKYFHLKSYSNGPKIYLFGIPEHNNMGDQAILFAELKFFNDYFNEYDVVCIPDAQSKPAAKKIGRKLNSNDIVFFHGGGNMGDIWEGAESRRFQVLTYLKNSNCAKIIFPMSTSYNVNTVESCLPRAKEYYVKEKKIILSARESLSFKFMKDNFNTDVYFIPDIVLSLDQSESTKERSNNIVTMLRTDKEKGNSTELINRVVKKLSEKYKIVNSDTMSKYYLPITNKNRNKLLEDKWKEFRDAKLIITDRLHGLIFSVITGTPAIIFDNSNHKVKFTYHDWLKKMDNIMYVEDSSLEDIIKIIDNSMLKDQVYNVFEEKNLYQDYANYIKKMIAK